MSDHIWNTFVTDIRKYAPNIDNYINEQLYLLDVEDIDSINEEVIFNLVMGMTVHELERLGITIDGGSIYEDVTTITLIKYTRMAFSIDHLQPLFTKDEDLTESVSELLVGCEENYADLPSQLIELVYTSCPLKAYWEYLNYHRDSIIGNAMFHDHIRRLIDNIVVHTRSELSDQLCVQYAQRVHEHSNSVRDYVVRLMRDVDLVDQDRNYLNWITQEHDADLVYRVQGNDIVRYLDENDIHPAYTTSTECAGAATHKRTQAHHIEHYVANNKLNILNDRTVCTSFVILIVADSYRPYWTAEQNMTQLMQLIEGRVVEPVVHQLFIRCMNVLTQG